MDFEDYVSHSNLLNFRKQKLIGYNHLEGDPGLDGAKNSQLFTDILNMVCSCADNSSPDRYTVYTPAHWTFILFLYLFGIY